jgi:hypothetical protein
MRSRSSEDHRRARDISSLKGPVPTKLCKSARFWRHFAIFLFFTKSTIYYAFGRPAPGITRFEFMVLF